MHPIVADTHYLGREAILDRTRNLAGFALSLRPVDPKRSSDIGSAAALLHYTFGELGVDGVLGRHKGLISLNPALFMDDVIDSLPADRIMLNLADAHGLSAPMLSRCAALKKGGFSLALPAEALRGPGGAEALSVAHILSVNVAGLDAGALAHAVRALRPTGRRLLASGVESPELAHLCLQHGFDYLQGHHFIRPHISAGANLAHGQVALMGLQGLIMSDAELDDVVDAFKHYPDMSLQLLRLASSAALGARAAPTSIGQAITVLGRNALQRWLQVLMFSTGGVPGVEYPSPLLLQAATRGKLMELLARDKAAADRTRQDQAFMVGMLSLLSAQFGVEIEKLIECLPLPPEARAALLERTGPLGVLLFLVESLEQPGFVDIMMALEGVGTIDNNELMALQVAAMNWANSLDTGGGKRRSL